MTSIASSVSGRARQVFTRRLLRIATGVVVAAVIVTGVVLVLPTVEAATEALVGADLAWVAAAIGAEAVALLAFATLHHRLLSAASVRVGIGEVSLVTLAANALHLTVPGGAALSTAYTYKKRREWGASATVTTWTMVAGGVAASLALAAIAFGSALVVGGRPTSLPLLAVQILGVAALAAGTVLVARRPSILVPVATWGLRLVNRARRRPRDTGVDALGDQIAALSLIELRGSGRAVVASTAMLKWIGHISCLAACAAAVGAEGMTLALVLVAYAAATAASSAALLPGGLGLVDGALLAALVAGGVPSHPALAAVLLYRLISFVGVAAVGWVAWLVVHTRTTQAVTAVDQHAAVDPQHLDPRHPDSQHLDGPSDGRGPQDQDADTDERRQTSGPRGARDGY